MYLYPNDKKLLKLMIKVQKAENNYVVLDINYYFHHSSSWESYHVKEAMNNKAYTIKIPKGSISASLKHLITEGYVTRVGMSPSYQVTHEGWNVIGAIRHDFFSMIVTHFAFPSLVAFITTIITNHFTGIVSWLSKLLQFR